MLLFFYFPVKNYYSSQRHCLYLPEGKTISQRSYQTSRRPDIVHRVITSITILEFSRQIFGDSSGRFKTWPRNKRLWFFPKFYSFLVLPRGLRGLYLAMWLINYPLKHFCHVSSLSCTSIHHLTRINLKYNYSFARLRPIFRSPEEMVAVFLW